jgi:hypothetical protein
LREIVIDPVIHSLFSLGENCSPRMAFAALGGTRELVIGEWTYTIWLK